MDGTILSPTGEAIRYVAWQGTAADDTGYHVIDSWSGASVWQGTDAAGAIAAAAAHNARPREPRPRRGRIQHEGYYGHRYRRPRMDRRRRAR